MAFYFELTTGQDVSLFFLYIYLDLKHDSRRIIFYLLICRENKAWILHVNHLLADYQVVLIFKAWAKFEMSLVANFRCRFKA